MSRIVLKPGRGKSLEKRHPWVFSGAVEKVEGAPGPGDTVEVFSHKGDFLARAAYSPASQIRLRVWSWDEREKIDGVFFKNRLHAAAKMRGDITGPLHDSFRLVNSESDGLPGVIIDRYGSVAVIQLLTAGADRWRDILVKCLGEMPGIKAVYERSGTEERKLEGLEAAAGHLWGEEIPALLEIKENGLRFLVDVRAGHKTGFYLDQRDNRLALRDFCQGKEVLDCFCSTGGFTLNALTAGAASVTSIDSSGPSLEMLARNLELNGLPGERCTPVEGDVFRLLRKLREENRTFDTIILDPPKFAQSKGDLEKAMRGYKDINMQAFQLLKPGGVLFTFSCSGLVSGEMFQKAAAWAAMDAGVQASILKRLFQPPDHPVALNFPEGLYLKGMVIRISPL